MEQVRVSIYVDNGCWAGSALLIKELLAVAGTLQARSGDLSRSSLFEVTLVGPTRQPVASFTGPALVPDKSLRNAPPAQIVIIPSFFLANDGRQPVTAAFKRWVMRAHEAGAFLVALTSGVRLLAETGLLDGHEVTGNLSDQRTFSACYPRIRFSPHTPLIIDGRVISTASINPSIDACAYLVGHFFGQRAAQKFARFTNSVAQPTYEQLALAMTPYKQHADQRIKHAQANLERYFMQEVSIGDAARQASMSVRNFTRRFQLAAGIAPVKYLTLCRVEHAKHLLAQRGASIREIALQCGFNEEATFRRAFKRSCGVTPSRYRTSL